MFPIPLQCGTLEVWMPRSDLSLEKRGRIAYVTLARPEKQTAIDGRMLRDLADACQAIGADEEVRVAVVTGGDGPVFSSGWDWGALATEDPLAAAQAQGLPGDP